MAASGAGSVDCQNVFVCCDGAHYWGGSWCKHGPVLGIALYVFRLLLLYFKGSPGDGDIGSCNVVGVDRGIH